MTAPVKNDHKTLFESIEERGLVKRAEHVEGNKLRAARVVHTPLVEIEGIPPTRDHCIVFSLRHSEPVYRFYGTTPSGTSTHIRTTTILPAGIETRWRAPSESEVLHIYLDDAVLREHINDTYDIDPGTVTIMDTMGAPDQYMAQMAQMLLPQIGNNEPVTKLMIDGFEQIVAAHLMVRYSGKAVVQDQPVVLDDTTVSRVRTFIRENLESELTLKDLAGLSSMSLFTFARAFKAATGTSPHQMLLAERVARVADLLEDDELQLAQIAYAAGFSSQSHMTTTFAKHMGVTPGRYRKEISE